MSVADVGGCAVDSGQGSLLLLSQVGLGINYCREELVRPDDGLPFVSSPGGNINGV